VRVVASVDVLSNLVGREPSAVAGQKANRCAGIARDTTALIQVHVGQLVADDLVTSLGVHLDSNLVRHRPGGAEERCLLAKKCGGLALKRVDGFVFTEDIVADISAHHRFEHGRSWARHRVTAYVDRAVALHRSPAGCASARRLFVEPFTVPQIAPGRRSDIPAIRGGARPGFGRATINDLPRFRFNDIRPGQRRSPSRLARRC